MRNLGSGCLRDTARLDPFPLHVAMCSSCEPFCCDRTEPRRVIIVEGILIFCDPCLRDKLDVKIFVDTVSQEHLSGD